MHYVLVTGYRRWENAEEITSRLDQLHEAHHGNIMVIQGDCPDPNPHLSEHLSADMIAKNWAIRNEVPYLSFPARWKAEGKIAGPMRNKFMTNWLLCIVTLNGIVPINRSNYTCLAFLHPESQGTVGCIYEIKNLGMEVEVING